MERSTLSPAEHAAIRFLSLAFRAGRPLRLALDATLHTHGTLAWHTRATQAKLLEETVHYVPHECPAAFSFGERRVARFLRLLMHEVDESCRGEVDEGLIKVAEKYCTGLREGGGGEEEEDMEFEQEIVSEVFEMPGGREVVVRVSERFSDMGMRVWEAGLMMCGSLECGRLKKEVCGKQVLELGAGTGITASGYVAAGVEMAMLTDVDEEAVENLRENVLGRKGEGVICAKVLDMMEVGEVERVMRKIGIEVVVAADVSYSPLLVDAIVEVFGRVVAMGGVGYLFVKERSEMSEGVGGKLEASGVKVERVIEGKGWFEYMVGWELGKVNVFRVTK